MYASLPKAPVSTQPLMPPARASSIDLPWRSSSSATISALKMEGCPQPWRTISRPRLRNRSGFFLLNWRFDEGCKSRISSITSRIRYVTSPPPALAHDFEAALEKPVGIFLAQLEVRRRLQKPHLVDHVENQIRHVADP